MSKLQTTITITLTLLVLAPSAMAQQPEKDLLLATNRTGTMQDELNEAGARGYRFAGTQGGETAFGGREAVVIVALDRYRERLQLYPAAVLDDFWRFPIGWAGAVRMCPSTSSVTNSFTITTRVPSGISPWEAFHVHCSSLD